VKPHCVAAFSNIEAVLRKWEKLDEEFTCTTLKYEDEKQMNTKIQQYSQNNLIRI